jgi:hypothetical protein
MSLYGTFERLPLAAVIAASSIVFSAAYSIYLFNRIAFGGSFSLFFKENVLDLNKREFFLLFVLVFFTVLLGIYPAIILDSLHFASSSLIYQTSGDLAFSFFFPLLFRPKNPCIRSTTHEPSFLHGFVSSVGKKLPALRRNFSSTSEKSFKSLNDFSGYVNSDGEMVINITSIACDKNYKREIKNVLL